MGKGDRKTRRGKIHRGTFGVRRMTKKNKRLAKMKT
ncbi:MAG: 30S ribosomal protein THX [Flavobacteriaceae bacterium]